MFFIKNTSQQFFRRLSYQSLFNWYAKRTGPKPLKPPYNHIVQIGDPILRNTARTVVHEDLNSEQLRKILARMRYVFEQYNCVGLAAPQIGIPMQIIMLEVNKKHAKMFGSDELKVKDVTLLPQCVILNPSITITDYNKIVFPESCESVKGFWADVPRYKAVTIKGLNEYGDEIYLEAQGWLARIVQHEVDHLNGKLYTDIMDRKSFTCSCWSNINEHNGKVKLPYYPS